MPVGSDWEMNSEFREFVTDPEAKFVSGDRNFRCDRDIRSGSEFRAGNTKWGVPLDKKENIETRCDHESVWFRACNTVPREPAK